MKKIVLLLFLVPMVALAQTKHPSGAKKLYNQASKAYENGEMDEALKLFGECVEIDPTYAEAYLNMSLIYYFKNDFSNALVHSRNAYNINKFSPVIYSQLGKCMYHNEFYDSTIFYLNKSIDIGSQAELDYIYLGKAQNMIGDYASAADNFTKAIGVNPNNPVSYMDRGNSYYNMAMYDKAEADYLKVKELLPQETSIYTNLANIAIAKNEPEKALDYINKALVGASGDDKIQILILKGNYYHKIGELDSAMASFNQAYALDNESPVVLTNQAAVMIDQENYEGAIAKCNDALDIDSEMMEAYFNRGIAYEMVKNTDEACLDWEQAFILGSEKAEEYLNSPICNE